MKLFLLILCLFTTQQLYAHHTIIGIIYDEEASPAPGVSITELGTKNKRASNLNGYFELQTTTDSCTIQFDYIGYMRITLTITSDTVLYPQLLLADYYNTRWLTIGAHYQPFNGLAGITISNGLDEEPFIHFEEFQDRFLLKLFGSTDFNKSYLYGIEVGVPANRHIGRTTLMYTKLHLTSSELFLHDLNVTSIIRYIKNTALIVRMGYQQLNDDHHVGFGLGLEQHYQHAYFGIRSTYYFDYFHHEAYLQFQFKPNSSFNLRTSYQRINQSNLLVMGLHYAFVRSKQKF